MKSLTKILLSLGLVGLLQADSKVSSNLESRTQQTNKVAQVPFPTQYGTIVFTKNTDSAIHIYVIGQRHHSPLEEKKKPDAEVGRIQKNIYRICEYLIKSLGVELILDEGLDADKDHSIDRDYVRSTVMRRFGRDFPGFQAIIRYDDVALERTLTEVPEVDAAGLLMVNYDINVQGIENVDLHKMAMKTIGAENLFDVIGNQLRSHWALISAHSVLEREVEKGRLRSGRVVIIIGNAHLSNMQRLIEGNGFDLSKLDPELKSLFPPDLGEFYKDADTGYTLIKT